MKAMLKTASILIVAALIGGCGGKPLKSRFPENKEDQLRLVLDKLQSAEPSAQKGGKPVLAVVLEGGQGLMLVDLNSGKPVWERKDIEVSSAPAMGEGAVLLRSEDKILALSADRGSTLWKKSVKENYLYGFAFDSGKVFVTMGNTNGGSPATGRQGKIMALEVDSGRKVWTRVAEKMLGAPAAAKGLLFVPWDRQAISIFDAEKGEEICRLIRKDATVDFIIAESQTVYYGSASDIQMLTMESASGMKTETTTYEFEVDDLPGKPRIFPDSYVESSYDAGAHARNRLLWGPGDAKGQMQFSQDMIYLVFYTYVIGFNAMEKLPVWVHMNDVQVAVSQTAGDGILLLGMDGTLTYIDGKTGTDKVMWKEDLSVNNAFFVTAGFKSPDVEKEEPNLHRGLVDMILDVDTQVLPLRRYGMKLLALIPDDMVTLDLVQVMSSSDLPKALRDEAALLLRTRKGGVEFLVEALEVHYNFLNDTPAPPSGAIASSLVESGHKKSVNLLLNHFKDHETPVGELVELSAAIIKLGGKKVFEPLKNFIMMYHADSSMSQHVDVLVNVAKGILKFGGEEGKEIVDLIANDPKSPESLRFSLVDLLKSGVEEEEEGEGEEKEGKEETEKKKETEEGKEESKKEKEGPEGKE